ncbi:hypothetical protein C8R47DRAFT_567765 [Mycena vitilis]|nr:hypothetical protein C8R47DRAFT_567765 [Mycena vitilis]
MAFNLRYVDYPASPDREFPCDLCPLSFDRQHDLKRHIESHSGEKPYLCDRGCGKAFTRKDALKRHQTTFPFCPPVRGPPPALQPAPICNSVHSSPPGHHPTYGEGSRSASHHSPGYQPVPYGTAHPSTSGPPISTQYGSRNSSTSHYPSGPPPPGHYGGRGALAPRFEPGRPPPSSQHAPPFILPPLNGGDYPASPARPFPCDSCPLTFERNHDLKRHMLTHAGERPYVCNGCDKTFTRKDALKRHQLSKECGSIQ